MRTAITVLLVALSAIFQACTASADDLIAFVGEKISVKEFEPETEPGAILMDLAFKARYRVVEVVYGDYRAETIEFEAYDHYGRPAFEEYQHVLLFVSSSRGTFYHQKYQYFPVFKTKSGVWAGCGDPYRFGPDVHRGAMRARGLDFDRDAYFDIAKISRAQIQEYFRNDNFEIRGNKAYCKKGNTVKELFEVKKEGVLKARGIFPEDANQAVEPTR